MARTCRLDVGKGGGRSSQDLDWEDQASWNDGCEAGLLEPRPHRDLLRIAAAFGTAERASLSRSFDRRGDGARQVDWTSAALRRSRRVRAHSVVVLMAALLVAFGCVAALAQVPVQDTKREKKETSIARCVAKSQQLKQSEISPRQNVTKSVSSPGSAGGAGSVGNAPVLGQAPSPGAVPSAVAGVDLSGLTSSGALSGQPSPAPVGSVGANLQGSAVNAVLNRNLGSAAQQVGALAATANALSSNSSGLSGIGGGIGSANGVQGAWDQNSSSRVAGAAVWGQGVQAGTLTLQMTNDRLLRSLAAKSEAAKLLQFDPNKVILVK
jgi:hypothetical protein